MSSPGQWEVVSKNKKTKQNGNSSSKLSKAEKKKFAENAPKVEDILPLAQVKSLYTAEVTSDIQEPKKPKETKSKEDPKKGKEKKQPEKKKEPKEKAQKPSSELDEGQLLAFISEAQSCYSEVPLAWLRDFAAFISTKLGQSQHAGAHGTGGKWPSSLLPPKVRKTIESVLLDESEASQLAFFGSCLTSLANDMSKGHSAIGQRIILQIHINISPQIVGKNMDKLTAIRNSYQNRPPICLAILEAIGQAGFSDITTGIKVWSEVMCPLIEMRHYSKWIVTYLGKLTDAHAESMDHPDSGSQNTTQHLSLASFSLVIGRVMPPGNSLTSQLQKELLPHLSALRSLVLQHLEQEELEEFFLLYLPKLLQSTPKFLHTELLDGLIQCLTLESSCFSVWQKSYESYLPQSVVLLQHICNSPLKSTLGGSSLCRCLQHFESVNESLRANGEDKVKSMYTDFSWNDLEESSQLINEFLEKAKSAPKAKGFPFIKGSFFCILGIIGLIAYDVRKHGGNFKDSSVGHLASDVGALPTIESAIAQVRHFYLLAYEWLEEYGPIYYKSVAEVVGPFLANGIEAISHVTSSAYNYMVELYPVIMNWIDTQVPGFRDKCGEYISHGWELFQMYSWKALDQCCDFGAICFQWAKENIFVGKLSAENLQKLSMEAYNMTQMYAGLTIDWVFGKMQ
ncbi:transmembrane protein 214 [Ischnura elegans]|uniref:transmembrane protein 214 n=1 Tax=Ischnura elegans TaxID=197161 RepID=UPI001ED8A8AF|nr:transmembrane protein 214 [Ischnura elegans]